jgi:PAS domain S-box-containing protein
VTPADGQGDGRRPRVLLERRATFEPALASAGAARRLVRDTLVEVGREEWLDAGELAVSEVVTNAALHAHTPIDLHLEVLPDRLRVAVRDRNPEMPLQRHYDDEATTGRGMGLVAAIALECGVDSLGAEGKVAWFSVGDPPDVPSEELAAAWALDDGSPQDEIAETAPITLASMPATLWLAARQHHDALLRELVLHLVEHPRDDVDLAAADVARSIVSAAVVRAVEVAQASGAAGPVVPAGHPSPLPWSPGPLTLVVDVPVGIASGYAALQDVLDVAEALATSGELFARPGLPEVIAVRDWACEQVIAQLAGVAPAPWPGTSQERFEVAVHDRVDPVGVGWDEAVVTASERGVVAADQANRILAVSRPLADLLGWEVEDLVGRRVVTMIPPALREAHVAGFTRHLATGEAHVLGVPLRLPVLRADGSEIECDYLVELADSPGRTVYLAWITPIG